MKHYAAFLVLVMSLTFKVAMASDPVILATEFITGLSEKGMPFIQCAFKDMKRTVSIIGVPWVRAQTGTEQGNYDGFFMASINDTRNAYAVFSQAFQTTEWLYVVRRNSGINPKDENFHTKYFAANRGSARYTWLAGKYKKGELSQPIVITDEPTRMVTMLKNKRIDVILENSASYEILINQPNTSASDFKTFVAKKKVLGIYFSKTFLLDEPKFLDRYNKSMRNCQKKLILPPLQ